MRPVKITLRIACIALIGAFILLPYACKPSSQSKYSVMKGPFIQSVTESGELQAINSVSIIMPRFSYEYGYNFKLVGIRDHGYIVKKGDSVAVLDPSSIYKYIIQQEEALEKARGIAEKQKVESGIRRRDLEIQFKNEEASYNLKKLELERMQFESEKLKIVKELEFEKAGIKLNKVEKKLALYPILEKYDTKVNELTIRQRQSDIKGALDVLQNTVLYSPGSGYFQISDNRRSSGQKYKLGDEVYMGSLIATIPDISKMKALSFINEMDIRKVKEGAKVVLRLDALPEISFEGTVKDISSMCTQKDNQKIFTTEISIIDNDARLKPGMSVSCEYICYSSEEELYVPSECLLSEGGKVYVFLKKGKKFKKTEVETGISNVNYTIIHTKLMPGRELLSLDKDTDL